MYSATPVTVDSRPINQYEIVEPSSMSSVEAHKERLSSILGTYRDHLEERKRLHLGYPYNLDFDFDALQDLQKYSINNLGDPWVESNYGVHSRDFEVAVLNWFANLWEIEIDEMWGYVTNCGTEGNLHGILVGREALPNGVLYCSKESHYSVMKAARMYRMEAKEVGTTSDGTIDLTELESQLRIGKQANKGAIINVNCGTTVKGAVDDLDGILALLSNIGYTEDEFYIHVDGALFGMMIPFVRNRGSNGSCPAAAAAESNCSNASANGINRADNARMLSFRKPIGSVSVSGHKFIGAPVPCGVVMTRKRYINNLSSDVEYLNSKDATIMGSRNGHAALYIWLALSQKGLVGLQSDVELCMRNATFLKEQLERAGVRCLLNPLSSTVVFDRPLSMDFILRWQLACQGEVAHVVVMPSVSSEKLETFVKELVASNAAATGAAATAKE